MRAVLAVLLLALSTTCFAQQNPIVKSVTLRGAEVTREHAVFGVVRFAGRTVATINLGFAHGVKKYDRFFICRRKGSDIIPISILTIRKTKPETSYGTLSTAFQVRPNDYAIIRATDLDIWTQKSRLTLTSREQLIRKMRSNRYDQTEFSGSLNRELSEDYTKKEREQPDGILGSFQIKSDQYKADFGKKADPASTEPITAEAKVEQLVAGLTTEEGESALLVAGFLRYLDQVNFEDGPHVTTSELVRIPLDPRNRTSNEVLIARRHLQTLNSSASRLFKIKKAALNYVP
ncbi:MAG: hypothetical protein H8E37_04355 [Planctomycetes bacterium]|nr:hypothetical protein [Planctomycetota bacterium]